MKIDYVSKPGVRSVRIIVHLLLGEEEQDEYENGVVVISFFRWPSMDRPQVNGCYQHRFVDYELDKCDLSPSGWCSCYEDREFSCLAIGHKRMSEIVPAFAIKYGCSFSLKQIKDMENFLMQEIQDEN